MKGSLPLAALVFVGAFVVTRSILLAAVLGGRLAELVMKVILNSTAVARLSAQRPGIRLLCHAC